MLNTRFLLAAILVGAVLGAPATARAQYLRIRDICRIKGQEENTLHGLGLVVGLKGTGDTDGPTLRALSKMLEAMGSPVSQNLKGQLMLEELKNAKNVAMVFVASTVPPEGARQGEQLNCTISAISAKSLEGGYLMSTPLVGPRPNVPRIYATAQGKLAMNESGPPTVGVIHDGCRLEEDFSYQFDKDGHITLVIDRHHAGFPTAFEIQEVLNGQWGKSKFSRMNNAALLDKTAITLADADPNLIARAIDPNNVRVRIPAEYHDHHVGFIAMILDTQVALQHHDARVVINERNGVIIVGDNVMLGRVAVTHKSVSIQTGDDPAAGPLFVLDQNSDTSTTRLKALVDALNALKVDSQSIIDIIKSLERSGDLYGRLVVE